MRLALLLLVLLSISMPARAQDPLVVPFTPIPAFMEMNADGTRTGFIVDLAELIGAEIGVPIEYLDVANSREFIAAQVNGETQLVPGILQLPPLRGTNVFSDQVAEDLLRPGVLVSRQSELEVSALEGRRIGVVPPAVGSEEPVLDRNTRVDYQTPQAALMELLSGQLDAVLLPTATIYATVRDARLDGRITFIGAPLRTATRHVALQESRSELLEPINAAIDAFEADGRLEAIRLRHGITVPPPPPDVLTVGVPSFPPYNIINEDGSFSGFSVEVLRDLLERAGLEAELQEISAEEFGQGPTPETYDMLPVAGITEARKARMDFSFPVERLAYSLADRAGAASNVTTVKDLIGLRIGVLAEDLIRRVLEREEGIEVLPFAGPKALVTALADGAVDAIVQPQQVLQTSITENAPDLEVTISSPFHINESGIPLRFGLGAVREQLNSVIPGYLVSGAYTAHRQQYFGKPVFWTQARVYSVIGAATAAILGLLGFLAWQRQRLVQLEAARNRAEYLRERSYSHSLQVLIDELEQTNREQSEFTYAISHDLKSPTNTIRLLAQDLREQLGNADDTDLVDVIDDLDVTTSRMATLIDDVLQYALSVGSGPEKEPISLNEVVTAVLEDLKADLEACNADVILSDLPTILGDRTQLRLVFQNLVENAIKFRAEGRSPSIRIEGEKVGNVATVRVSDNGIGIDNAHFDRIFGMFKRLHSHSEYEGTGLGLTLVKRIVLNHNGTINVSSEPGVGTAFEMKFGLEQNV